MVMVISFCIEMLHVDCGAEWLTNSKDVTWRRFVCCNAYTTASHRHWGEGVLAKLAGAGDDRRNAPAGRRRGGRSPLTDANFPNDTGTLNRICRWKVSRQLAFYLSDWEVSACVWCASIGDRRRRRRRRRRMFQIDAETWNDWPDKWTKVVCETIFNRTATLYLLGSLIKTRTIKAPRL